jgi:DNA-binding CsgD family transcriptional regulator
MTDPDNGRHNRLTIKQQNAVDCLILGKSDQETADIVGVTRQTLV